MATGKKGKARGVPKQCPHFRISKEVWKSHDFKNLSLSAKHLYLTLCFLRNELTNGDKTKTSDHSFWRWDATLCRDADLSRNTMKRARNELISATLLFVQPSSTGKGLVYTILDDVYQREMDAYRDPDALYGIAVQQNAMLKNDLFGPL